MHHPRTCTLINFVKRRQTYGCCDQCHQHRCRHRKHCHPSFVLFTLPSFCSHTFFYVCFCRRRKNFRITQIRSCYRKQFIIHFNHWSADTNASDDNGGGEGDRSSPDDIRDNDDTVVCTTVCMCMLWYILWNKKEFVSGLEWIAFSSSL